MGAWGFPRLEMILLAFFEPFLGPLWDFLQPDNPGKTPFTTEIGVGGKSILSYQIDKMYYEIIYLFPANSISFYLIELEDKVGGAEWAAVKLKGWWASYFIKLFLL